MIMKRQFIKFAPTIAAGLLILNCLWTLGQTTNSINAPLQASELIPAKLNGNYKDHDVDIDGDDRYDSLAIDVGVDIPKSGEYTLSGYIFDSRNREAAWSVDHRNLSAGRNQMLLVFEGRTIQQHGSSGNFTLGNLVLSYGDSDTGMIICDQLSEAFKTKAYNFGQFALPHPAENIISGSGTGEVLLTICIKKILPVSLGRYNLNIAGIHIPPINSPFCISSSKYGYSYNSENTYLPNKPNDFSIKACGVANLNIGLKKLQGSYENSSNVWKSLKTRTWVSQTSRADDHGVAIATSDLISPGIYDARLFGDAERNATHVELTLSLIKKVIVNGRFHLGINLTGFPQGNYSIGGRALNGTLKIDEISVEGPEDTFNG
jgi:hypothetical protein